MSNAFQNNALQPDAFQAHGGVTSGITVNINATQDGDSGLLTVVTTSTQRTGVPGPRNRFVVYVNGKRYYGTREEINRILHEMAEEDAETVLEGYKPPKRRIVVQVKRTVEKPTPSTPEPVPMASFDFKLAQDEFRRVYLAELSNAILEYQRSIDEDDEEVLLLL
jgi:hypothetical protein